MLWAFEDLKNNNNYVITINQTYFLNFVYLFIFIGSSVIQCCLAQREMICFILTIIGYRVKHAYVLLYYTEHPGVKL